MPRSGPLTCNDKTWYAWSVPVYFRWALATRKVSFYKRLRRCRGNVPVQNTIFTCTTMWDLCWMMVRHREFTRHGCAQLNDPTHQHQLPFGLKIELWICACKSTLLCVEIWGKSTKVRSDACPSLRDSVVARILRFTCYDVLLDPVPIFSWTILIPHTQQRTWFDPGEYEIRSLQYQPGPTQSGEHY